MNSVSLTAYPEHDSDNICSLCHKPIEFPPPNRVYKDGRQYRFHPECWEQVKAEFE